MPRKLIIKLYLSDKHCKKLKVLLFILLISFGHVGTIALLRFVVVRTRIDLKDFIKWSRLEGRALAWKRLTNLFVKMVSLQLVVAYRGSSFDGCDYLHFGHVIVH